MSQTSGSTLPEAPPELLAYCRELEGWAAEAAGAGRNLAATPDSVPLTAKLSQAIQNLGPEESLAGLGLVAGSPGELATNFQAVATIYQRHFPDDPLADYLARSFKAGDFGESYWSRAPAAIEDDLGQRAARNELDDEHLKQLANWAAAPFRRRAGQRHREDLEALVTHERGLCPVCRRPPDLAELSEGEHGRRYLICLPCDQRWHYRRMGCPFCGNGDFDRLGYLLLEDNKAYRVYCCEACKGYLKTVDRRQPGQDPGSSRLEENARTFFLDLLAVENGYR